MKIISIILILTGLYLIMNDDSEETKHKNKKIEYKGKYKDLHNERLVEIINPQYDIKHLKKN